MKIFGSGLQRTGTMSLTKALNQLNFPAKQFPKELHQDLGHPILNEYVAFTDFPIPLLYKELDKAYPGSKFIHTIRDEQAWLKSVQWLFTTGAVKFNLEMNHYAQTFHKEFYGIDYFDEETFLRRYREHNAAASAYFAARPDDFLVIDLTAGEGYEKICPFLGIPIPDAPFPNSNKSQDLSVLQSNKLKRRSRSKVRTLLERTRFQPLLQTVKGILSPLPLTSSPERLSCRPFFIITSGHSGGSHLRATLNEHPALCIPPESPRLGTIVNRFRKNFRYQSWSHLPALVAAEFQQEPDFAYWEMVLTGFFKQAAKLPQADQNLAKLIDNFYIHYRQMQKPTAICWGDKSVNTIYFLPEIEALFPTAQFIHIIRDGRDVAVSMAAQGLFPNPQSAGKQWLERVSLAREFGNRLKDGRFLEIKYETLVQTPESTFQKVCEFLALDYQPLYQKSDNQADPGTWRQKISPEEQNQLTAQLSSMLSELGYAP